MRPPLIAVTRSATFSVLALIVCVAPNFLAASSLASAMSIAMIGAAPAIRAPCTLFKPTPPQPMTSALAPVWTFAVLTTAPNPVSTPQAISAAASNLMSSGIFGDLALVNDRVLGEGARAQAVHDRLALRAVDRRRLVERKNFLAEHRRTARARPAEAAGADQRRDHMIARFYAQDSRADRVDDPGGFVPVDRRQIATPGAVDKENIAVADRAGLHLDPDLAGAGLGKLDLLDG